MLQPERPHSLGAVQVPFSAGLAEGILLADTIISAAREAPVPRYFFDLIDGSVAQPDREGTVLPDAKAARDEASEALLGIARDHMPADGPNRTMSVAVRDEDGAQILLVSLSYTEEPPDWSA